MPDQVERAGGLGKSKLPYPFVSSVDETTIRLACLHGISSVLDANGNLIRFNNGLLYPSNQPFCTASNTASLRDRTCIFL